MVFENGYVWLQLSTAPCRHGGSTTSTAAATYLRRSSRWAGHHKSNDHFSHNRSNCTAGGGVTLRGWVAVTFSCSSLPHVALPPFSSRWKPEWMKWTFLSTTTRCTDTAAGIPIVLPLFDKSLVAIWCFWDQLWCDLLFLTGFPGRLVLEAPEGGVLWEAGGVHRHHGRNSSTDRWPLPDLK